MLELELGRLGKKVSEMNPKRVFLQVPEGLKGRAEEIAESLEKASGAEVFVSLDPCYGACDLRESAAQGLKAELIVHLGHTKTAKSGVKTIFWPLKYGLNAQAEGKILAESLLSLGKKAKPKAVALCSTAQFSDSLGGIQKELELAGFRVLAGRGKGVKKMGQILGCNYSSVKAVEKDADAVVFVGDGKFHPLGLSLETEKPVYSFNPLENEFSSYRKEREMLLRQKSARIALAGKGKSFGLIVSTKTGQKNLKEALELKRLLEKKGKKAVLFEMDFVSPEKFIGLKPEVLVNTACPRIAVDDFKAYGKPIVNPDEVKESLKLRP